MSNAYQDIAVVVLRLIAIYLITGVIGTLSLFVALFTQEAQTALIAGPLANVILLLVTSLGLWLYAPMISRLVAKGVTSPSQASSETVNSICVAIIVAAGFLVFSQSFQFFARGSSLALAVALSYTGLAALMIFMPLKILRSAHALEGLKK